MALDTVKVPDEIAPIFEEAQEYVRNYFSTRTHDPREGTITIGGERYILVRAASMSVHFLDFIQNMYPALDHRESIEAASRVLFDIAHSIGNADARAFHVSMGVEDPIAKLSTGPIHFAYTGWAFVDIFPESRPSPDDNYYLIYDHPKSFEAESWIKHREKTDFCTCFMNAGYSSGWCEESFSVELTAKEILCRARGDDFCRFIMAPPSRMDGYVDEYFNEHPEFMRPTQP